MYDIIKQTPAVRETYAAQLAAEGLVTAEAAKAEADAAYAKLTEVQQALKARRSRTSGEERRIVRAAVAEPETAVAADVLTRVNEALLAFPDGFTVHPKLKRQLERRREAITQAGPSGMEWAHAEALAFGSLLLEGSPIRLTGQDVERGTFSQRHLVLHDPTNDRRWAPIQHLPGARAPFELHNSPLSEAARSEEHTSELQSHSDLVCRLLLEKKKKNNYNAVNDHIVIRQSRLSVV